MKDEQEESKKERKQRYNNRPGARKAPKGKKYIRKGEKK